PGIKAPLASATVPPSVALLDCANVGIGVIRQSSSPAIATIPLSMDTSEWTQRGTMDLAPSIHLFTGKVGEEYYRRGNGVNVFRNVTRSDREYRVQTERPS